MVDKFWLVSLTRMRHRKANLYAFYMSSPRVPDTIPDTEMPDHLIQLIKWNEVPFFTEQSDTLSSLYLIASFQGLFFALLLLARKERTLPDFLLASYFLSWAGIVANYYYLNENLYERFPYFLGFGKTLFFLPGPLLFLYMQATLRRMVSRIHVVLHLSPFILYNLLYLPFYMLPASDKAAGHVEWMLVQQPWFELTIGLIKITTFIGYNLIILYRVSQHRKTAPDNWSFLEQRTLTWLLVVAAGGILFTLLSAFAYRNIYQHGTNYSLTLEAPVFIAFSIYILIIGYYGYRQRPIGIEDWLALPVNAPAQNLNTAVNPADKYKRSGLTQEKFSAIRDTLVTIVEQKKLFLEPDLTVHDLSAHAAVPVHHITEVLNQHMGQSFYDFINSYRVAEARKLLSDSSLRNYTLEGIGNKAGFKSRSSFYHHFKRLTGMTPSAYQQKNAGM